ncbi:MAG: DegV family protein [Clostridia bacterium]|nr:DegV family protein [Clostridia bacterium]MBR4032311.1 DegV family protein [Clostridia bacterium]
MRDYVIFTDSSCDLPASLVKEWGIEELSLEVSIEGIGTFLNHEIEPAKFYGYLRDKRPVKTAAANMEGFVNAFEKIVSEGKDILYIGFSTGLSATYVAGKNAAEEVMEKHPECKILTVDSLCAALGQGLLVKYAVDKKNAGATLEELAAYVEGLKLNLAHWFTVEDLFFLKRGGRVSAATAVMGTVLQIKPVMHVDNDGKLINMAKARGRDASIKALVERMKQTVIDPEKQTVYICHGDCYDDAKKLADMVTAEFGITDILIDYVGPVIGAHSGPGTLALFFIGRER